MQATVRLDSIKVTTDFLEAIFPTPEELAAMPVKTPYPLLRKTGNRGDLELRTAVLENDWLQVTFCLDLGGRLLGLLDKRTDTWILEIPSELNLAEGGARGMKLDAGLELIVGQGERLNALGPVEHMLIEPSEEDDTAAVILHELIPGLGVSWHARWSLPNDAAKLELEFRALNRGLSRKVDVEIGIRCSAMSQLLGVEKHYSFFGGGLGIAIRSERLDFDEARREEASFIRKTELFPRCTDSFKLELAPYSGCEAPAFMVVGGTFSLKGTQATFQFFERFADDSLGIENPQDREFLEIPVPKDACLGQPFRFPVLDIRNSTWLERGGAWENICEPYYWIEDSPLGEYGDLQIEQRFRTGSFRGAARIHYKYGEPFKDLDSAIESCEEALLYIGDDQLTWWQIAALKRHRDGVEGDRPELLNAHFLAPMEPVLRAEAFLAMPVLEEKDPNPILAPLAAHPGAALDTVLLYMNAGLDQDMARLADDLLRHRDHAMIRYVIASRLHDKWMPVEAVMHLQKAESLALEGPLPWDFSTSSILQDLAMHYPDYPKLKLMLDYASCRYP